MRTASVLLLLALAAPALAQAPEAAGATGTLAGCVTDAEGGEALIGASVWIPELQVGRATGVDGCYSIPGLPAGQHSVVVTYTGFTRVDSAGVAIVRDETTRLDTRLVEDPTVLDELWPCEKYEQPRVDFRDPFLPVVLQSASCKRSAHEILLFGR